MPASFLMLYDSTDRVIPMADGPGPPASWAKVPRCAMCAHDPVLLLPGRELGQI